MPVLQKKKPADHLCDQRVEKTLPDADAVLDHCRFFRLLWSRRFGLYPKHAVFHQLADLCQRLVLDLADALLGHADDLADLFQSERRFLSLLPVKAAAENRLLGVRELGQ